MKQKRLYSDSYVYIFLVRMVMGPDRIPGILGVMCDDILGIVSVTSLQSTTCLFTPYLSQTTSLYVSGTLKETREPGWNPHGTRKERMKLSRALEWSGHHRATLSCLYSDAWNAPCFYFPTKVSTFQQAWNTDEEDPITHSQNKFRGMQNSSELLFGWRRWIGPRPTLRPVFWPLLLILMMSP